MQKLTRVTFHEAMDFLSLWFVSHKLWLLNDQLLRLNNNDFVTEISDF